MSTSTNSTTQTEWSMWTCDELMPNLCNNLKIDKGSISIKGINVTYWKYSRPSSSSSSSSSSSNKKPPLVTLHGGPAYAHNYILPLKQIACLDKRDVYFFDQAGCGESYATNITSDFPWLLTTEYYTSVELPALLEHWDIASDYHLLGHSWGTIYAMLFALSSTSKLPKSLILSGPLSDAKLYINSQWNEEYGSIGSLPPFLQERIRFLDSTQAYDSAEYQAIVDILGTKFTCRTAPYPDCFMDSVKGLNEEIYIGVQGPSEFTLSGVLSDFNFTANLTALEMPVLVTHGKYDTMRQPVVDAIMNSLKYAEEYFFKRSGHVSMIDEPEEMNNVISDFLTRVESSENYEMDFGKVEQGVLLAKRDEDFVLKTSSYLLMLCLGIVIGGKYFPRRPRDYENISS